MNLTARDDEKVIGPQPGPQTALISCPANEILFGGARGGGKSICMLLDWYYYQARYGAYAKGLITREDYPELEQIMDAAREIYPALGGHWAAGAKTWHFSNGSFLRMRYVSSENDADRFQGHEFCYWGVDEVGKLKSMRTINKMRAVLRSAKGLPIRMVMTANPGGLLHNPLKARFINPAPPRTIIAEARQDGGVWTRCYIPALVTDNRILMTQDPGYVDRIIAATEGMPWLRKAWLEGDWDIVAGGMFDDLWAQVKHRAVMRPFRIPISWRIDRAFDWGSSKPFSVGWWAESDGSEIRLADGASRTFPRGSLFRIAEFYGWNGQPNEGTRMLAVDVARGILEREQAMGLAGRVRPGPADSAIYNIEDGHSIADEFLKCGIRWEKADKWPGSRHHRWEIMRRMLAASGKPDNDEAGLYIFETCRQWLRTVPVLPRDDCDADDVSTSAEDHIADETAYRIARRKRVAGQSAVIGA